MKKRLLILLLTALSLAGFARADEILFVGLERSGYILSGACNGARDIAKTLSKKYSKKISIKSVSVDKFDAALVSSELSRAYLNGAKGAIIFVKGSVSDSALSAKISDLAKRGFHSAVIGGEIKNADLLYTVNTSIDSLKKSLDLEIAKFSKSRKVPLVLIGDENKVDADSALLSKKLSDTHPILKSACTGYLSEFMRKNKVEIMRFDNHAFVVLDASILSDVTPIKPDDDRLFTISAGCAPYMKFYFDSGFLDACVTSDYFGFGYCAARALINKIYADENPPVKVEDLPALVFDKNNIAKFNEFWRVWLKTN